MTTEIGPLAAALAKAQTDFPTVTRDKTVTVQTKTGGSYSFKYAPLDSILNAVRQPLAANGLVIVQLLDDGALVTSLIHESGAILSGRVDLPNTTDIQGLGSAITYLRRYAIQGMLGIAAEDDDDGNHAAGNRVKTSGLVNGPVNERESEENDAGETLALLGEFSKSGRVARGTGDKSDCQFREEPDGWRIGFRLEFRDDKNIAQVIASGPLGAAVRLALAGNANELVGQKAKCSGLLYEVRKPGRQMFLRLIASAIETDEWTAPADAHPGQLVDDPVGSDAMGPSGKDEGRDDDLSDMPDEWKAPVNA